jgi:hypothetical protein
MVADRQQSLEVIQEGGPQLGRLLESSVGTQASKLQITLALPQADLLGLTIVSCGRGRRCVEQANQGREAGG